MREAAVILSFGGNVQIYENPGGVRDGRLIDWRQKRLGQVGRFVKKTPAVLSGIRDHSTGRRVAFGAPRSPYREGAKFDAQRRRGSRKGCGVRPAGKPLWRRCA